MMGFKHLVLKYMSQSLISQQCAWKPLTLWWLSVWCIVLTIILWLLVAGHSTLDDIPWTAQPNTNDFECIVWQVWNAWESSTKGIHEPPSLGYTKTDIEMSVDWYRNGRVRQWEWLTICTYPERHLHPTSCTGGDGCLESRAQQQGRLEELGWLCGRLEHWDVEWWANPGAIHACLPCVWHNVAVRRKQHLQFA